MQTNQTVLRTTRKVVAEVVAQGTWSAHVRRRAGSQCLQATASNQIQVQCRLGHASRALHVLAAFQGAGCCLHGADCTLARTHGLPAGAAQRTWHPDEQGWLWKRRHKLSLGAVRLFWCTKKAHEPLFQALVHGRHGRALPCRLQVPRWTACKYCCTVAAKPQLKARPPRFGGHTTASPLLPACWSPHCAPPGQPTPLATTSQPP